MFIPYSTDAPIYHWPVATVGLIVVNIAIFALLITGNLPDPEFWILPYGEGLTPVQWITSAFMHGSIGHVLGNMIFLWIFGIVIEGKIGWRRFLACYLLIAGLQSFFEQSLQLMLGGEGGSLGASSAIYGLMAMAAIWAPKNEITVFYWFAFIVMGTIDISIMTFAFLYIGWDMFWVLGRSMVLNVLFGISSSSWLHVGGAMIGAPLAIIMLKTNRVDCEGWDIFHMLRDDLGGKTEKEHRVSPEELDRLREERDGRTLEEGQKKIKEFLENGNGIAAYTLYLKLREIDPNLELPPQDLSKMVGALHKSKRWRDSCPLMAELVKRYPDQSQEIKIKLAQIAVVELQRPGRAIELLKTLDLHSLRPATLNLVKKIAQRAKQMQAEGIVELDDDQW